jgi:tetratricopeptide (TPR) repeat protein
MAVLCLEAVDYVSDREWRWVLKDSKGAMLADHSVKLAVSDVKLTALIDLRAYIRRYASPDKELDDERFLIGEIGEWLGEAVLGKEIGEKILTHVAPPTTVRVILSSAAEGLLLVPLDLSHAAGRPLAAQNVRMVFELASDNPPAAEAVEGPVRVLALFSLPEAGSPLNLRRERQMLRSLVRRLTGAHGLAVELRVLQYGVTRESLRDVLEDGDGWDVIHFSGHGQPGTLVLETIAGKPDLISSIEVSELLALAAQRLKLVFLSACLSAAGSIRDTLIRLGAIEALSNADGETSGTDCTRARRSAASPAVARALSQKLDCAVVAMRYAVEDEFAIDFASALYDGLLTKRQLLPHAVQTAILKASGGNSGSGDVRSLLSLATPGLFGARAVNMRLTPPKGEMKLPPATLAYFPREQEHFVGRVSAMTRASSALAIDSDRSGVIFYGIAGAGKTSCAVELAYHHSAIARFQSFVWYEAPKTGNDIALSLRNFAVAMEQQVPSLTMVHVTDDIDMLRGWLPQLTEILENYSILIVIDNVDTLMTREGVWRDERWQLLMDALLSPGMLSRIVLTSRVLPVALGGVETVAVHALPLKEAILLMRELPNFRRLLEGSAADRDLARRTLLLVQGHPKLIRLAEALASDAQKLSAQLVKAELSQGEEELNAFFRDGESSFDPEAFTRTLHQWTHEIAGTLPAASLQCFYFLCALEEQDRQSQVLLPNWGDVWQRLKNEGAAPPLQQTLQPLITSALIEIESGPDETFSVRVHPGVAEAAREAAGESFQRIVDVKLARTWLTVMDQGLKNYGKTSQSGSMIVRSGLGAFPYLARLGQWSTARILLSQVLLIEWSPATIAAVLPRTRRILEAAAGTDEELKALYLYGRALIQSGRNDDAEGVICRVIEEAVAQKNYSVASYATGDLSQLLNSSGRLSASVEALKKKSEYTRLAGLGPWTIMGDKIAALQVESDLGDNAAILRQVKELQDQIAELDPPGANEPVADWNIRETLLDCGRMAAAAEGQWEEALSFIEQISSSERGRAAPKLEQAMTAFNSYAPLLRLRRYKDAETLLLYCKSVFEAEEAVREQGATLSAFADLEDELGRPEKAQRFERAALRFKYLDRDAHSIAVSHTNLAIYLSKVGDDQIEVTLQRLAAAVLRFAIRHGLAEKNLLALASSYSECDEQERKAIPRDFETICKLVERIEGVRFRDTVMRLVEESEIEQLLADIWKLVDHHVEQFDKLTDSSGSPSL